MSARKARGEPARPAREVQLRLFAQLMLRLDGDLALRLRQFCTDSGRSMNAVGTEAIAEYLARHERTGK